ncbi:ankyrin repeat domain-containing protein [Maricaulis sp. CAU 1757]
MKTLMVVIASLWAGLAVLAAAPTAGAQVPEAMATALSEGDAPALQAALAAGADPDARHEEGLQATALMLAAAKPDPVLVEILLAAGAALDTADAMGDPAINWAAYYGHGEVIAVLLAAGADITLSGHGTAPEILMRRGHQAALANLVRQAGLAPDRGPAELALEAALDSGDAASVARLAAEFPGHEARDFAGRPVIQAAARSGRVEALEALLAAGWPVDAVDTIGFTALFEAARDGQEAVVERLLAAGADAGHVAEASALSLTPLHMAAIGGHVAIIETLLAAGAPPDAQGSMGGTPMLWAAYENQEASVLALLRGGADPAVAAPDVPPMAEIAEMLGWSAVAACLAGEDRSGDACADPGLAD